MKRKVFFCLLAVIASSGVFAGDPFTLDRNGVLWTVRATVSGTLLEGTKEGQVVVRSQVPFPLGAYGPLDTQFQLAADDLTGKIVLAWQRNWAEGLSSIVLAVWDGDTWSNVVYLSEQLADNPRNPTLKLSQVVSNYTSSSEPGQVLSVRDSYALVAWWEGHNTNQRPRLAILKLSASSDETETLAITELATSPGIGINCPQTLDPETVERPIFASSPPGPTNLLLVASPTTCLLFVHEIRFELEPPPTSGEEQGGLGAVALRRRHTPIFGVRKVLPVTRELSAEGTRAVLGADLQPVLYRVVPEGVEYTVATATGWSPKRILKLSEGVSLDQAIALVENLAR